jgi:hypothetical protein
LQTAARRSAPTPRSVKRLISPGLTAAINHAQAVRAGALLPMGLTLDCRIAHPGGKREGCSPPEVVPPPLARGWAGTSPRALIQFDYAGAFPGRQSSQGSIRRFAFEQYQRPSSHAQLRQVGEPLLATVRASHSCGVSRGLGLPESAPWRAMSRPSSCFRVPKIRHLRHSDLRFVPQRVCDARGPACANRANTRGPGSRSLAERQPTLP